MPDIPFSLRIAEGRGAGRNFVFDQRVVRIGRLPDNDLVLYDTGVSRHHCEIIREGTDYSVHDVGSANGTLLNGARTTEAVLESGDHLRVGPVTFEFSADGELKSDTQEKAVSRPDDRNERKRLEEVHTTAGAITDLQGMGLKPHGRPGAPTLQLYEPKTMGVVDDEDQPLVRTADEARTATGSFASYHKQVTVRSVSTPLATRLVWGVAALVVLAGVMGAVWVFVNRPAIDRSNELFAVSLENAAKRFGAGRVDVLTADRVNFQFVPTGGRLIVSYAAGGVDTEEELEVLLNGSRVGFVPKSVAWTPGFETELPARLLTKGMNILTFDNTLTPAKQERWGVSRLKLVQREAPVANPKRAKELFALGKGSFETRSVAPQNLYKAIEYLREARLYVAPGDSTAEPSKTSIESLLTEAEGALEAVHNNHLFSAQKAARFGNRAEAADIIRDLLRYYPDPNERHHKDAKARLNAFIGR